MSVTKVVMEARAAGIQLGVEGDDLVLEAPAPPSPAVLDLLSLHKTAIVLWLQRGAKSWSAEDWSAFFDERAGIAEIDGGQSPAEAEAVAFECCVVEWLNSNLESSDPNLCTWCGQTGRNNHAVVPFGVGNHGQTWLHPECWNNWHSDRREKARQALERHEIKTSNTCGGER